MVKKNPNGPKPSKKPNSPKQAPSRKPTSIPQRRDDQLPGKEYR